MSAPRWLDLRRAPRELRVVGALLAGVLGAWLATRIVDAIGVARIRAIDRGILIAFRQPDDLAIPIGPVWLLDAARELSSLGSATVLVFVIFSVGGYLLLQKRHAMLGFVLFSTFGGMALTTVLKGWFGRSRPSVVPHLVAVHSMSFPSGHSLLSAVVYLTLGVLIAEVTVDRVTRVYFVTLAALLTGLIGITRVYLGVHYPTDVLGGWMLGLIWALGCGLAARELQRRHVIQPVPEPVDQRVSRSMPTT